MDITASPYFSPTTAVEYFSQLVVAAYGVSIAAVGEMSMARDCAPSEIGLI